MVKKEFIDLVAAKLGSSKKDAGLAVDAVFASLAEVFESGEKLVVNGLGVFQVRTIKARTAVNPRTGEKVQVPATKRPLFTASSVLKAKVK
ncbi:MAG: HU family DNA-binding protein [Clostridia bacterium]|nr:HU family DNA-binding protein [Clostridia bacterium]